MHTRACVFTFHTRHLTNKNNSNDASQFSSHAGSNRHLTASTLQQYGDAEHTTPETANFLHTEESIVLTLRGELKTWRTKHTAQLERETQI